MAASGVTRSSQHYLQLLHRKVSTFWVLGQPSFSRLPFGAHLKVTLFGLTLSSSWGNGHATPYRAILRALHRQGARLTFYEKDAPYYARHRDFETCDYCDLRIYSDWSLARDSALKEASDSDVVISASYTPEGARISDDLLGLSRPLHVFYDLDTPITLSQMEVGSLDYLRREQIPEFDLYLSFTGGNLVRELETDYGAKLARPLYGCVDPDIYHRVDSLQDFQCDLSHLGTYAADRQEKLDELFLEPARRRTDLGFVLAGSLYPWNWQWPDNVRRFEHVAPDQHPALYSSCRATLNITRQLMADSGFCPSGRFFEAAACGTPILTDYWNGLETFFDLQNDLLVVRTAEDVLSALTLPAAELQRLSARARQRTLDEHTGEQRAAAFLAHCNEAWSGKHRVQEVVA
jgi:spore maturation protein CgeB